MGSGVSIPLKCPSGYKEKFANLLTYFDRLDRNGDHALDPDEFCDILTIYRSAKIADFEKEKEKVESDEKHDIEQNRLHFERQCDELTKKCDELTKNYKIDVNQVHSKYDTKKSRIQTRLDQFQNSENQDLLLQFRRDMKVGEHVDFWTFFKFMKDRSNYFSIEKKYFLNRSIFQSFEPFSCESLVKILFDLEFRCIDDPSFRFISCDREEVIALPDLLRLAPR